jgi:Na+-translocating ferredoxin:NAD+ oxidoreductase RNF subunit RnfB
MSEVLIPVLVVSGIGLAAGLMLDIASLMMAVPKDEKAEAIRSMLPGANCGACGFSGCDGYAKALSAGTAKPGLCTVGGAAVAKKISDYLGCDAGTVETKVALVQCRGTAKSAGEKAEYEGIPTCAAADLVAGGGRSCRYGCLGLGDCARACDYGAISVRDGLAVIDPKRCRACSRCIAACPKHLIHFTPYWQQAVVLCSSCDRGADAVKVCQAGCIACRKCERTCPHGAIRVKNNLASVDITRCTGCGACAKVCPRHCIAMLADL